MLGMLPEPNGFDRQVAVNNMSCLKQMSAAKPCGWLVCTLAAMIGLLTMCGTAAAWGEKYYEFTLQKVLSGDRDAVLMIEVRGRQVRRLALRVPEQPNAEAKVNSHQLKLDGARLSGPVEIQVGRTTENLMLDLTMAKGGTYGAIAKGGTYSFSYGVHRAEGKVVVEPPQDAFTKRWGLRLENAMRPGAPLLLAFELDRAAKTVKALSGSARQYNTAEHPVDAARLAFDGTNLLGEVGIVIMPDRWVPADKKSVPGTITLKASIDGTGSTGRYTFAFGTEKLRRGDVTVRPGTAARIREVIAPIVSPQTPWRVWLTRGSTVSKGEDGKTTVIRAGSNPPRPTGYNTNTARMGALPPEGWRGAGFDDSVWGRYGVELFDTMGGYGYSAGADPALLCLRTRFGVSKPSRAKNVQVQVEYLGGVVVYVNGEEVGRGDMPDGNVNAYTLAKDYPINAYTTDDKQTPLPRPGGRVRMDPKLRDRYEARIRKVTLSVPRKLLVKGANVLALQVHRAPVCGPVRDWRRPWGHLGIRTMKMISSDGAGVVSYTEALKGTRVWNAQALEQVAEKRVPRSRIPGSFGRGAQGNVAQPISGFPAGNPFDPIVPIRFLVPRNGMGSGQVVLSDSEGLRGVTASVVDMKGPAGSVLPAKAVRIWFAWQDEYFHWCDNLSEKPAEGATTMPVWLEVQAAKDQAPGWYVSTLSICANGRKFDVPVQVFVTGYVVPDSRDLRSLIGVMHSPDGTASAYGVRPWSDEHFRIMAGSLEAAGQLGNDVMYVPVITRTHMGHNSGLIRWVKTDEGLQPDFSLFEKYLDLYSKYCAAPKAISLYIWTAETAKEVADSYEGRAIPTRTWTPKRPLQVTQWDPKTGSASSVPVPTFLDEGAKAFWNPMLDGVHAIVTRRGWSERAIMFGCGSDRRPSQKVGEVLRDWAPYARWDIYSHFSGDPGVGGANSFFYKGPPPAGSAPGKLIAIGNLEVGLQENPWGNYRVWLQKLDFLAMALQRGWFDDRSSPMLYKTIPVASGRLARFGLDFWRGTVRYDPLIWGCYPIGVLGRGPDGPVPTVRLLKTREGLQEFEPRLTIIQSLAKLPAESQKQHRGLLNEFNWRCHGGNTPLSQSLISLDWTAYVARVYRAGEELSGIKTDAKWEEPPE